MSTSFSAVEGKVLETEFFLIKLKECKSAHSLTDIQYYFSAYLSAARSVTFTLQHSLHDIQNFDGWYKSKREKLENNKLATFFKLARNDSQKTGLRHINSRSFSSGNASFYYTPWGNKYKFSPQGDLVDSAEEFFKMLLEIIYDCFHVFGEIINPDIYYSLDAIRKRGQTVTVIEQEIRGYPKWTSFGVTEEDSLKYVLQNMVKSPLVALFEKYLNNLKDDKS